MGILELRYPLDLTDDELAAGFEVREAPTGLRAVVRELGNGLRVLKTRAPAGRVEYTVCDADCNALYPPAPSLAEIEARFGKPPEVRRKPTPDDPELSLLLDNLELLEAGLRQAPQSDDIRALEKRLVACRAVVNTWKYLAPRAEQRTLVRREVLSLRDQLSNAQSKVQPPLRLATLRPVVYQAAVLALNAHGGPVPEEELHKQVEAQCAVDAVTWQAFLDSEPLLVLLSNGTVAMIPRDVPGGEKAMSGAQYEVVRLTRIARKPLTLRELVVLLRYQNNPAATWDLALLRNVLALEPRLHVAGDVVSAHE